jgi:hypothetical protein
LGWKRLPSNMFGRAQVGANAGVKIGSQIAGVIAGADDIDGIDLLRMARSRPRLAVSAPLRR